jgi:hypothetical protein
MSTTQDLVIALKAELRNAGLTYADLADGPRHVGVERQARVRQGRHAALAHRRDPAGAEDGFRRAGGQGVDSQPLARSSPSSRKRRWWPTAGCCCWRSAASASGRSRRSQEYAFSDAECIKYLARLDHLGIIELRPLNRYRLKVAKAFAGGRTGR